MIEIQLSVGHRSLRNVATQHDEVTPKRLHYDLHIVLEKKLVFGLAPKTFFFLNITEEFRVDDPAICHAILSSNEDIPVNKDFGLAKGF
jgi:DNA repair protein RadA/Sms